MGMYTELSIGVEFKHDTPQAVLDVIAFMATGEPEAFTPAFDHPLFAADRWRFILRSGGSYYFDAKSHLTWAFDDAWYLTVRTNIKNYSSEWERFLAFIAPHLESDGFIGTIRYEEAHLPDLLVASNGRIGREIVCGTRNRDEYGAGWKAEGRA